MTSFILNVTFDSSYPPVIARFWAEVTGSHSPGMSCGWRNDDIGQAGLALATQGSMFWFMWKRLPGS
jgi:hypothetical protein